MRNGGYAALQSTPPNQLSHLCKSARVWLRSKLPDCHCVDEDIRKGLNSSNIHQIFLFIFDDGFARKTRKGSM